jgi:PAS domain S-box-containing protein
MTVALDEPAQEIRQLQRCISDLVTLVALPASWAGADPAYIARTLLDTLESMLGLDLLFLRLVHPFTGAPTEMSRVARGLQFPTRADAVAAMLEVWLEGDPPDWPPVLRKRFGDGQLSLMPLPVGPQGDLGVLVAGSARNDFPNETERLLLTVAKNQALIALREVSLLSEQKLLAETLDRRVAQRTAELATAAEGLRKSEARKTAILDSALDSIVTIDHEGRITEFNHAAERTFGYRREDVLGAMLGDVIVPPALRERHRQGMTRYLATGRGVVLGKRLEMSAVRADGTEFPVELAITRITGDGPPSFTGYLRDITDEKQREAFRRDAEEKLRRSEAYLAEAQRLSLTGSFSWRLATDEITWSEQVYRILELDPAVPATLELIRSRVHPDDLALFGDVVEQARADGGGFEFEHRLLLPDQSVKYLHVVAHALPGQGGRSEFVGAVQDVSERRRSQEALDQARAELTHVARVTSLGALTASITHEVSQPLAGIVTNASTCLRMLAADPPNVEGARETVRRTIRDGHRASEVVTRLRGLFARKAVVEGPVDLNDATREVIALTTGELRRGRVTVRQELADDLPTVSGDRVQLQQVILNLLLNAADAMSGVDDRPRGLVIRTDRDGTGVRLSVEDSGVGFAPEDGDRLFEAFYTTKSRGMGIGLSVSRFIIERHQGRLSATRNEGPGATFAFTLPTVDTKV